MGGAEKNFIKGRDLKLGHIFMIHRDFLLPDAPKDDRPDSFCVWKAFSAATNTRVVVSAHVFDPVLWVKSLRLIDHDLHDWLCDLRDHHRDELKALHALCRQEPPPDE